MAKIELSEAFMQKLISEEIEELEVVKVSPSAYAVVLAKPFLNMGMHYSYRTHLILAKSEAGGYEGKFPLPPFITMGLVIGLGAIVYDLVLLGGTGVNLATMSLAFFLLGTIVAHAASESRIQRCLLE